MRERWDSRRGAVYHTLNFQYSRYKPPGGSSTRRRGRIPPLDRFSFTLLRDPSRHPPNMRNTLATKESDVQRDTNDVALRLDSIFVLAKRTLCSLFDPLHARMTYSLYQKRSLTSSSFPPSPLRRRAIVLIVCTVLPSPLSAHASLACALFWKWPGLHSEGGCHASSPAPTGCCRSG